MDEYNGVKGTPLFLGWAFIIGMIIGLPLLFLWALNTLSSANLAYDFKHWFASTCVLFIIWLMSILRDV